MYTLYLLLHMIVPSFQLWPCCRCCRHLPLTAALSPNHRLRPPNLEAFGVEQFGRLVLVEKGKLAVAVKAMEDA